MPDVILLPGIIAPAAVRYAPLLAHLDGIRAITKDLEVYAGAAPPPGYTIRTEIDGIAAAADAHGLGRFHLYGHSGGGACALAFAAAHPGRVRSLAVDEPASDFSVEDLADPHHAELASTESLPEPDATRAFLRLQLAPGVEPPPLAKGPPQPWMATRPAGLRAFRRALVGYHVDPSRYEAVTAPVLYTHGSLSHPRWFAMRDRLGDRFADFSAVLFEGLHHLSPAHQADPARTAQMLRELWARAEAA